MRPTIPTINAYTKVMYTLKNAPTIAIKQLIAETKDENEKEGIKEIARSLKIDIEEK